MITIVNDSDFSYCFDSDRQYKLYKVSGPHGLLGYVVGHDQSHALDLLADEDRLKGIQIEDPTDKDYENYTILGGNGYNVYDLTYVHIEVVPLKGDFSSFLYTALVNALETDD